jgi:hypothetical protein
VNDNNYASGPNQVVVALRELIEALDRRVPQVERVGEVRLAREAAALRKEAARRIQELTGAEPGDRASDTKTTRPED